MKLSIIVPIYKVEPYLRKCIDSILAQTFTDFELILVDDGSPDNCPAICDEYALKEDRIIVIHKENGGLSSARNAGLDIARGEYIGFVDSDDWIHPQMYEILLSTMLCQNADIVQCTYKAFNSSEEINLIPNEEARVGISLDKDTLINNFFDIALPVLNINVWSKLYKRGIFDTIRFPIGIYYEDLAILLESLSLCNKYIVIENQLYYYCLRENSIIHSEYSSKKIKQSELYVDIVLYFRTKRLKNQVYLAQNYAFLFYCRDYFAVKCKHPQFKKTFTVVEKKYKKYYYDVFFNPYICNMKKLMIAMMYLQPKTAYKLCRKYFPECLYEFMR